MIDDETIREMRTAADMAGLSAEFGELLADAERYRWLRASSDKDGPHIYGPDDDCILDGFDADAAIDAAMAGEGKAA